MHLSLNPAEIITGWTALIAVVSLANKFFLMPYLPKVARAVSAIVSIPSGHLANFLEDAEVLWSDITNPPPPAAGSGGSGTVEVTIPPAPKAPTGLTRGLAVASIAILLPGCALFKSPAVVEGAVQVEQCVAANWGSWQQLVLACSTYTLEEIEAAIQTLLADKGFQQAHPDAIDPLKTRLGEVRAKLNRSAVQ